MTIEEESNIIGSGSTGPTPEQWNNIKEVVDSFDKDWMIDMKIKQIKQKPKKWWEEVWFYLFPRKHTVFALYWWLKNKFHGEHREELMPLIFPIEHDNMPIPGHPIKYKMVEGWTIRKRDLRYLNKGPLARVSSGQILVPYEKGLQRIITFVKTWGPMVALIGALLTIILRIFQLTPYL